MDNKNVFIAIALSMSVLLFWAAFFESPKPVNNDAVQQQQKTSHTPAECRASTKRTTSATVCRFTQKNENGRRGTKARFGNTDIY